MIDKAYYGAVERVRAICKERRISISKLERECGFGNGYISHLIKGSIPFERICVIADYLDVPTDYIMYGKTDDEYYTDPNTAKLAQEMFEDPDMHMLFHMKRNMDPEKFQAHIAFMRQLYAKEHPNAD